MICKSCRPPTGCAHAAKLLEYWQNRQILENLEPSNTFKAKAILKREKNYHGFSQFVCVSYFGLNLWPWRMGGCFLILLLFWAEGKSKGKASGALFQSWPLLKFFSDQKVCRTNFCQQPPQLDKSLNKLGQKRRKSFLNRILFSVFVLNISVKNPPELDISLNKLWGEKLAIPCQCWL